MSKKCNEIYLLIKYIKSILWKVTKRLSYIEDAWCLKVKKAKQILFGIRCHSSQYFTFRPSPTILSFVVCLLIFRKRCKIGHT